MKLFVTPLGGLPSQRATLESVPDQGRGSAVPSSLVSMSLPIVPVKPGTVASAENGESGMRRLNEFRPDTVVCDFYLPDTDGLQILRRVRSQASHPVTFIVITGACGGDGVERLLKREADFFLQKPVDLKRLRSALERTVAHGPGGPPPAPPAS